MMSGSSIIFLATIAVLLIACDVDAFTNQSSSRRALLKTTALNARPRQRKPWSERERQTILSRNGEHFKFDRMRGDIEFGSSSRIQTILGKLSRRCLPNIEKTRAQSLCSLTSLRLCLPHPRWC